MPQPGFFDLDERYAKLNEPLCQATWRSASSAEPLPENTSRALWTRPVHWPGGQRLS